MGVSRVNLKIKETLRLNSSISSLVLTLRWFFQFLLGMGRAFLSIKFLAVGSSLGICPHWGYYIASVNEQVGNQWLSFKLEVTPTTRLWLEMLSEMARTSTG